MSANCICILLAIAWHVQSELIAAPKIKLNDGREMPSLALGTWLGNNTKGRITPVSDEVQKAVETAIDLGYRHVDTASAYKVEDQVGRALATKMAGGVGREELFVTTKLWNDAHARRAVVPALRQSLQTLGLEYVDLYLIHWPLGQFANQSYDSTDYVETWRGMIEAKKLGLARSIGVSNFNQSQLERLEEQGLETPAVLQVEVNLNFQQAELLNFSKGRGIAVMGYTPFGSLFYGKARADAPSPRVDDERLVGIGRRHNKTVTQVVLRYLLDLSVTPIPKALSASHLASNFAVFDFTLSASEREILRSFNVGYRTVPQRKWITHMYYPFDDQRDKAKDE